jgi:hypothetical protein
LVVPREVLALTRGKRALMAGGQGERETQRAALQKAFDLAELEWVVGERNQASPFQRLEARVRPGAFDLVLFLSAFASHKASGFVRACKDAGIPLVYLPRGYSPSSVAHEIDEQLVRRKAPASSQA